MVAEAANSEENPDIKEQRAVEAAGWSNPMWKSTRDASPNRVADCSSQRPTG